jgi:hypothetical protein
MAVPNAKKRETAARGCAVDETAPLGSAHLYQLNVTPVRSLFAKP